ncbi:LruC domain-containing protein [Arcticibacter eurypsychrophilus]|uniref:LruC domain-containing protein n=1 Tax=Arcticibacter eurypsychrophilus TaxID=1434752 RepID=UPI0009F72288|nr:LruC domain-containing protein [Arcticibacter eurypsychrophilus]
MNKYLFSILILFVVFITSCQKSDITDQVENTTVLVVPSSFNWGTSRDVSFNISITDSRFANSIHVISIYAGDPANGGSLLSKGSATLIAAFNTKIYIPSTLTEVYVVKTSPDGSTVSDKIAITSTQVSIAIGTSSIVQSISAAASKSLTTFSTSAVVETSPDCGTGIVWAAPQYSWQASFPVSGGVYAVKADDVTINLSYTHNATLVVCGKNVILNGGNINGLKIIVTSTGSLTINSSVQWNATASIKNFGTLKMNAAQWDQQVVGSIYNAGTFNTENLTLVSGTITNFGTINANTSIWVNGGVFTNEGTVNALGTFNMQNGGQFINNSLLTTKGIFTVGGSSSKFNNNGTFTSTLGNNVIMDASSIITNTGTFTALTSTLSFSGLFTNDGTIRLKTLNALNGTFNNNCKLIISDQFVLNGTVMKNASFIDVQTKSTLTSNMQLSANAIFQTKDIARSTNTISGPSSGTVWSLFKVTGTSAAALNSEGGIFTGNLLYCDNLRTLDARHFSNNAKNGCGIYIPSSDCTDGYGTAPAPVLVDTDKDGVIDLKDDYPSDPTKAYRNLQANYANGGSTVAFEDTWPSKGDYDMNDIVLNYRYEVASNAANIVVEIKADYKLLATGGSYKNGTGIQFNIPAANLESITGATVETNQDSLVVILFSNSRNEQTNWNTSVGTEATAKEYSMTLKIKNGPTIAKLGVGNYNVFIWNAGSGRGYETHLAGKKPTKLANTALFGTADDNSTTAKPYFNKTGLPWALEIPVSAFSYPTEKTDITKAYLHFAKWAISGGTSYTDWYSNTSTGYKNISSIFAK